MRVGRAWSAALESRRAADTHPSLVDSSARYIFRARAIEIEDISRRRYISKIYLTSGITQHLTRVGLCYTGREGGLAASMRRGCRPGALGLLGLVGHTPPSLLCGHSLSQVLASLPLLLAAPRAPRCCSSCSSCCCCSSCCSCCACCSCSRRSSAPSSPSSSLLTCLGVVTGAANSGRAVAADGGRSARAGAGTRAAALCTAQRGCECGRAGAQGRTDDRAARERQKRAGGGGAHAPHKPNPDVIQLVDEYTSI